MGHYHHSLRYAAASAARRAALQRQLPSMPCRARSMRQAAMRGLRRGKVRAHGSTRIDQYGHHNMDALQQRRRGQNFALLR